MASLRQIRRRIKSVQNTRKITRAMEMVAASKLRRFEDALGMSQHAANFVEALLKHLIGDLAGYEHPLFEKREKREKTALTVFSSDSGLCGVYNSNVLTAATQFSRQFDKSKLEIIAVGKTAQLHFKSLGYRVSELFCEIRMQNLESNIQKLNQVLTEGFIQHRFDAIYLTRTQFFSKANFKPVSEQFLPLEVDADSEEKKSQSAYILEPNARHILEALIPEFLYTKMRKCLLEALLSEQVSRMIAMRQATDNAQEMIESLTLLRNRVRQAAITKELIEIVSGAKALDH